MSVVVADSSALVAIVNKEPEAVGMIQCLARYGDRLLPASCYLEATMVLLRRPNGRDLLDSAIACYGFLIVPIDETVIRLAADAFEHYGKGRGHRAQLNFGDCMAYASAKAQSAALLFKGGDFARTDVIAAT